MTDPLSSRLLTLTLAVSLAFTCIFVSFPGVDLAVSRLFTDANGHFPMADSTLATLLNNGLKLLLAIFFALALLLACISPLLRGKAQAIARNCWFLVAVYAVGPGLIVNAILKSWVGRARPITVTEFGGDRLFTPMLQISDQCVRNCSFSSGEVATTSTFVFALLALSWAHLTTRGRYLAASAGAMLICLSMTLRIGLGRHFLSDTLTSVAIAALVTLACWSLLGVSETRQGLPFNPLRGRSR
ncbi:phosphatase PAP2 family protein [Rhodobacter sp.]